MEFCSILQHFMEISPGTSKPSSLNTCLMELRLLSFNVHRLNNVACVSILRYYLQSFHLLDVLLLQEHKLRRAGTKTVLEEYGSEQRHRAQMSVMDTITQQMNLVLDEVELPPLSF